MVEVAVLVVVPVQYLMAQGEQALLVKETMGELRPIMALAIPVAAVVAQGQLVLMQRLLLLEMAA